MKSMSDNHFFHGYKVSFVAPTVVSHLQFADDTLIIAEKSWANVRAMHVVLILFEAIYIWAEGEFHKESIDWRQCPRVLANRGNVSFEVQGWKSPFCVFRAACRW